MEQNSRTDTRRSRTAGSRMRGSARRNRTRGSSVYHSAVLLRPDLARDLLERLEEALLLAIRVALGSDVVDGIRHLFGDPELVTASPPLDVRAGPGTLPEPVSLRDRDHHLARRADQPALLVVLRDWHRHRLPLHFLDRVADDFLHVVDAVHPDTLFHKPNDLDRILVVLLVPAFDLESLARGDAPLVGAAGQHVPEEKVLRHGNSSFLTNSGSSRLPL